MPIRMNRMSQPPNGAHGCPDGRHGFMPQMPKNNVKTQMIQNQMFAVMVASYGVDVQGGGGLGSGTTGFTPQPRTQMATINMGSSSTSV
jgi:hypothetical protein